jgi:esterase FrsA
VNDAEELKRFAMVHTNAQRIPRARCAELLARVKSDEEGAPGSWAVEWSQAAAQFEQEGRFLEAYRFYNMARFPFVDGPTRLAALGRCVGSFERVAQGMPHVHRDELDVLGTRLRCWSTGLSRSKPRPLLLLMGGIVSIKEQWAPILAQVKANGMAGLVAEMPRVGENPLPYDASSWQLISALLDAVGDRADTTRSYALALSFSGHLALRCAARDDRIKGVITSGAPIRRFFRDPVWQQHVPAVTVDTIAHLCGIPSDRVFEYLAEWELTDDDLSAVNVPVAYLASRRDEIIPPDEPDVLRTRIRDLRVLENDDVHGSPQHTTESGLWALSSVLRMRGGGGLKPAAIAGVLRFMRLKNGLIGAS